MQWNTQTKITLISFLVNSSSGSALLVPGFWMESKDTHMSWYSECNGHISLASLYWILIKSSTGCMSVTCSLVLENSSLLLSQKTVRGVPLGFSPHDWWYVQKTDLHVHSESAVLSLADTWIGAILEDRSITKYFKIFLSFKGVNWLG